MKYRIENQEGKKVVVSRENLVNFVRDARLGDIASTSQDALRIIRERGFDVKEVQSLKSENYSGKNKMTRIKGWKRSYSADRNKKFVVMDEGKIISKHVDFYNAQLAVDRHLKNGKISNFYKIISLNDLKKYKGHYYYRSPEGLWIVLSRSGGEFIVALDDSKISGGRKMIMSANNEKTAKKYIDSILNR
jgi:hypothetical protein